MEKSHEEYSNFEGISRIISYTILREISKGISDRTLEETLEEFKKI